MGEFTFTKKDGGWYICNADGKYLAVDRSELVLSKTPFAWKYSLGVFSADTKVSLTTLGKALGINHKATAHLTSVGKRLDVSLLLGKCATFTKEVEYAAR